MHTGADRTPSRLVEQLPNHISIQMWSTHWKDRREESRVYAATAKRLNALADQTDVSVNEHVRQVQWEYEPIQNVDTTPEARLASIEEEREEIDEQMDELEAQTNELRSHIGRGGSDDWTPQSRQSPVQMGL